jgi:hypothetical protein
MCKHKFIATAATAAALLIAAITTAKADGLRRDEEQQLDQTLRTPGQTRTQYHRAKNDAYRECVKFASQPRLDWCDEYTSRAYDAQTTRWNQEDLDRLLAFPVPTKDEAYHECVNFALKPTAEWCNDYSWRAYGAFRYFNYVLGSFLKICMPLHDQTYCFNEWQAINYAERERVKILNEQTAANGK